MTDESAEIQSGGDYATLNDGQLVEYEVGQGRKGHRQMFAGKKESRQKLDHEIISSDNFKISICTISHLNQVANKTSNMVLIGGK